MRVELDTVLDGGQAAGLVAALGSVAVRAHRGRSDVRFVVTADDARQAVVDGLDKAAAALRACGIDARAYGVDAEVVADTVTAGHGPAAEPGLRFPEVAGVAEVQQILDVGSRQQVHQLAQRPDFPEPVARLVSGRIWLRRDIEDFGRRWQPTRARRRRPGAEGRGSPPSA